MVPSLNFILYRVKLKQKSKIRVSQLAAVKIKVETIHTNYSLVFNQNWKFIVAGTLLFSSAYSLEGRGLPWLPHQKLFLVPFV